MNYSNQIQFTKGSSLTVRHIQFRYILSISINISKCQNWILGTVGGPGGGHRGKASEK